MKKCVYCGKDCSKDDLEGHTVVLPDGRRLCIFHHECWHKFLLNEGKE